MEELIELQTALFAKEKGFTESVIDYWEKRKDIWEEESEGAFWTRRAERKEMQERLDKKAFERRLEQHENGEGANHTKKRLPVSLLYYEEYQRIDEAFNREKQVQGWSRKKKEALIEGNVDLLPELAKAYRDLL